VAEADAKWKEQLQASEKEAAELREKLQARST
jgi:hypothetical protein